MEKRLTDAERQLGLTPSNDDEHLLIVRGGLPDSNPTPEQVRTVLADRELMQAARAHGAMVVIGGLPDPYPVED